LGRFEIAKGETPEPEPEKKVEVKKPSRRIVINYEDGDKSRQIVIDHDESTEIPSIRRRPDAHPRTHVGGVQDGHDSNANEAFDHLLDQLIDKDII
jgi:hypothetical protein